MNFDNVAIVTGVRNLQLAKSIADQLSVELITFDTKNWPNNQPRCFREKGKSINGKTVFIVQSLRYDRVGSPFEELKMIFEGCKGAAQIHLVITWMCTKDDVQHISGQVATAPIFADVVKSLMPKSILLFDLHQKDHSGFFHYSAISIRHFRLLKVLTDEAKKLGVKQIAAADFSGSNRVNEVEKFLLTRKPLILAAKVHDYETANTISHQSLYGSVTEEVVGIFDDMALTIGTMIGAAKQIKEVNKTARVYGFAVHFDPSKVAYTNLVNAFNDGVLDGFYTTNTCAIDKRYLVLEKFHVCDVSGTIVRAIELISTGRSTSELFLGT